MQFNNMKLKPAKGFVYKITSPSDRVYIGSTTHPIRRKNEHKNSAKAKVRSKLINSIISHG